jgi:hypothetical protein
MRHARKLGALVVAVVAFACGSGHDHGFTDAADGATEGGSASSSSLGILSSSAELVGEIRPRVPAC